MVRLTCEGRPVDQQSEGGSESPRGDRRRFKQGVTQAEQGELDKAAAKAAVKLGGFAVGLPSSQINKTVDAVASTQDGREVMPWQYVTGPAK